MTLDLLLQLEHCHHSQVGLQVRSLACVWDGHGEEAPWIETDWKKGMPILSWDTSLLDLHYEYRKVSQTNFYFCISLRILRGRSIISPSWFRGGYLLCIAIWCTPFLPYILGCLRMILLSFNSFTYQPSEFPESIQEFWASEFCLYLQNRERMEAFRLKYLFLALWLF